MKTCKNCGALNYDDMTNCSSCGSEMNDHIPTQEEPEIQDNRFPLWMYVAVGISLMLLVTYAVYAKSTGDYTYAPVIFPLLACSFLIIGGYWVMLWLRARKENAPLNKSGNTCQEGGLSADATSYPYGELIRALDLKIHETRRTFEKPQYQQELSLNSALEQMLPDGYGPDRAAARALLAAMASKRAVIVSIKDENELLGMKASLSALSGTDPSILYFEHEIGELYSFDNKTPAELLLELTAAAGKEGAIAPIMLSIAVSQNAQQTFSELFGYLDSPYDEGEIGFQNTNAEPVSLGIAETAMLSGNTRIYLCFSPDQAYRVSSVLFRHCAFVDLTCEHNFKAENITKDALSFERLEYLADEAVQEYFLSEPTWKKIDELVSFIKQHIPFVVDNQLTISMERFVGVYMATGADETQALDAVLASLLLPCVLANVMELSGESRFTLSEYMEEHFGLENLPLCTEVLKKFSDA